MLSQLKEKTYTDQKVQKIEADKEIVIIVLDHYE